MRKHTQFNVYLDLEKRLAALQGWTDIHDPFDHIKIDEPEFWGTDPDGRKRPLPIPTRSWDDCGPLMVLHDCYPHVNAGVHAIGVTHTGSDSGGGLGVIVMISEHECKESAARFAIVFAVVRKLELTPLILERAVSRDSIGQTQ